MDFNHLQDERAYSTVHSRVEKGWALKRARSEQKGVMQWTGIKLGARSKFKNQNSKS